MPSDTLLSADSWPPATRQTTTWFPTINGQLTDSSEFTPVTIVIDSDPANPQSTLGGRHLVIDAGVAVQPPLEVSDPVKTFATEIIVIAIKPSQEISVCQLS